MTCQWWNSDSNLLLNVEVVYNYTTYEISEMKSSQIIWIWWEVLFNDTQVRVDEGDNTAQYWPNPGSQESAIVIGPVSPFASVKCWADDDSFFRLFKLTDLLPKMAQYWPYTKPIVTFTMTIHSGSEKTWVWHSIGPFLCQKQVLAARVWPRIGRQVHTGVIIPATGWYWQPIFGKCLAMLGQCWTVSNFALGHLQISGRY